MSLGDASSFWHGENGPRSWDETKFEAGLDDDHGSAIQGTHDILSLGEFEVGGHKANEVFDWLLTLGKTVRVPMSVKHCGRPFNESIGRPPFTLLENA